MSKKSAAFLLAIALSLQGQSRTLSISQSFQGKSNPVFSHGKLITRDAANSIVYWAATDGVWKLYDFRSGAADRFRISDASMSPDGGLIAVGTISTSGSTSSAIVLVNPDGSAKKTVLTNSFGTSKVIAAEDSRIIVAGRDFDASYEVVPNSPLLRVYSSDGVLLKKGLSRADLKLEKNHLIAPIKLLHAAGRTVVISPETHMAAVLDSELNVLSLESLPSELSSGQISNCTMLEEVIYCSVVRGGGTPQLSSVVLAWRLSDKSTTDITAALNLTQEDGPTLAGSDGSQLVIRKTALNTMNWISPPHAQ